MYKKHLFCFYPVFLSVLALVTSCVTGGASASRPVSLDRAIQMAARSIESNVATGQRQKIALLNFNSPSEQFSEYVLEELTGQLVNGKKLIVVDRRELELIRQEENFQMSGEVSDESAQAIGKKLGAQLIVSGSLNAIGKAYRIRIRALNVETAAIEASPSADISAAEEKVIFLLDGKGSIQVNTNFRQTTTRTASKNINFVVAGSYYLGSTFTACYWVNGVRTDLSVPNGKSGFAYGIAVSGGKVYALGLWGDEATCYWVDGVRTDLNGEPAFVFGIAVSGGTVYAAGVYNKQNNDLTDCYWVNGIRTDLDLPFPSGATRGSVETGAIAVSSGKVYVAGSYEQNSDRTACYWVDKARTDLPFPSGATRGSVNAIAVSGGKVYVAGSYEQNSDRTACYWVNGVRTDLDLPVPSGATIMIEAIAIEG